MSNTKFTKGPWKISEVGDRVWIDDEQGFSIASVFDCKGAINNASLIASAPDMYAMLDEIAINMHKTNSGCIQDILAIERLLEKSRGE